MIVSTSLAKVGQHQTPHKKRPDLLQVGAFAFESGSCQMDRVQFTTGVT